MSTIEEKGRRRSDETYAGVAATVRRMRATARRAAMEDTIGLDLLDFLKTTCAYAEDQRQGLREYLVERRETPEAVIAERRPLPEPQVHKLKNWKPGDWSFDGFE